MRPSRTSLPKALVLTVLAGSLAAGSAFAQFYDPALRSMDLVSDVPRSPRLLGMGGLSLAVPDRDQGFTLWSFAGSPVGAFANDTSSTLELRPTTGSISGAHLGDSNLEREDRAGRATTTGFEAFHRDDQGTAWGAVGRLSSLRSDEIYSATIESRTGVSMPEAMPIMTGPFPYWGGGKLRYAARLDFGSEHAQEDWRNTVSNAAGQFISLDGTTVDAPSTFLPNDSDVRRTGFGLAASYPFGKHATIAAGYDVVSDRIEGQNVGHKSESQVNERRPYGIAQGTLVGTLGKSVEYGIDDRYWNSSSEQDWYYTISAGVGALPLEGRGKLLERSEKGNAFNGKARWTSGAFRLAAQFWTNHTRVEVTPPGSNDPTSFNRFLPQVYYRVNADTLALPDSIVANETLENAAGYGFGASWTLRRGVVGIEYHAARLAHSESAFGAGPRSTASDLRAGLEYACSPILVGRLGAGLVWRNPDEYQTENKQRGESASAGFGLRPPHASWGLELGWQMTWLYSDYDDPLVHRASRQQLQTLLHWSF